MPLTDPIREPLTEVESLIPGLAPTFAPQLPGIQTNKTLLYQTPGSSSNSEQPNLIETAKPPQSEFIRAETDAFITNKASDINSIPSAKTSATKTNSYSRDSTTSEIDLLIGKLDSDLGDPLTNPNPTASNSEPFDSNKPVPHPPAISSLVSNSEINKTTPATTTASDKLPENKTQLLPTGVANSEKENNKTLPVITTSTNLEKASEKTPLPATPETSSKPEDNKTSLSSGATLKSDSEPNKTSPATVSTVDNLEPNKTSPATVSTDRSEPKKTSPATASTIIPDRSTTSSEKSEKIAVTNSTETVAASPNIPSTDKTSTDKQSPVATTDDKIDSDKQSQNSTIVEKANSGEQSRTAEVSDKIDSDKKAPIAQTSETKNSDKQLPITEAAAKIDSDKKSPKVDAIPTEKPISDSQQSPTTQPPTAPLIPATSNPVLPNTNISAEVKSTDLQKPVQTATQSLTDKQNDTGKVDPLKIEPAAIPKTAASENVTVTTATAAVNTPEKTPNNTDSVSEIKQPVKTESIVSQSADAELIKTDKDATSSISQPPAETESVIAPIAEKSPAKIDLLSSNVGEQLPKQSNSNVSTVPEQLPIKIESIIPTKNDSATVENESVFPEITSEIESELPTKTDSVSTAEFTADTIERNITVSFTAAELETEKSPALFSTPSETAAVTTQIAEVETSASPSTLKSPPKLTSNNYNSNSNPTETVAVLPAYSDPEIAPKSAEMTSGWLLSATEESAQLSDNIADTQPNSTQRTGDFQSNTNPSTNLSITAAANSPSGTFLVDNQGQVKFDYVFDGGYFTGEIGIFSLSGMEAFTPGTPEFIAEAARRVLTNSTLGNIVIRDSTEGAKFTGSMPGEYDFGSGEYQGIKTFNMTPGDTFAVMFVPSGTVQSSLQYSWLWDLFPENRPLFSIATANPNDTAHLLQIADITGSGNTFALEDMSSANSDRDYNDLIFKISGATGNAPLLDTVINPDKEWRNTPLGQQLLAEANPPNSDNNPPVVSPTSARTYTELETTISLDNLATDAEGDPLTISVLNPVNGTVIFNPLTNKASFKPASGFSGIASFDFLASDAFGSSTPARVTVNVSDVPLLNLDFVKRNPRLDAGENTELIVLGDFADQKGVVLPDSYLTYTSINPEVAPIDPTGKVTGLVNGTSILSASRNNLQAVTAVRVGKLPAPTNDAEFNGALAEINGLNVYPKAVTMTAGMGRSLLVGIENIIKSPDLKFGSTGTRYFPGNSNLLQVNSDGVITAIKEGVTNVTVIHGAAEQVVPVRVSLPAIAGTILGVNGGAVTGSDGSIVMVPPGALAENTAISLTSLTSNDLSLQLPDGLQFAGGFNLDLGDNSLKIPAQLAIPAPAGLSPGTEILFLRKGSLPDANNIYSPIWLIQESGVVDASGTIRTNSPPFTGILETAEIAMIAMPDLELQKLALEKLLTTSNINGSLLSTNVGLPNGSLLSTNVGLQNSFLAANAGLIGIAAVTTAQFAATILLLAYLAKYLKSGLKIIAIPEVGLPVVTPAGVELDPEGIPRVTATLNIPTLFPADPFAPPVLQSAEYKLENGEPTVVLTGSNFLNNSNDLGGEFKDLTVSFRVGDKTYPGTLIPDKNTDLGENSYKIAVKIPITVPLGESSIVVSRKQKKRFGHGGADYEIVELESEENIRLAPTCLEWGLIAERSSDRINVINLRNAASTVENRTSDNLAVAVNILLGDPTIPLEWPDSIAPTNNATRAYVTMRNTGRVSVVDLMALREIDLHCRPKSPQHLRPRHQPEFSNLSYCYPDN
ncbi:DUF4114 domain-containing protein [Microcoleus sp. PH2017_31_RDM_U_A]|uniref:DUF4114 domain-containing protein n=1 Tax=Microcoleus sp. PH2017_31_RDM_U_A TaxID=2798841 RepID=UPI0025D07D0B|nr:DUF4114 domain-containing protein [Microcoleus sp. PH2017_31_RDM_U_A]